ncbi:hypothetical protein N2152v2_004535 [Parachlorella kessleri]
MSFLQSLDTAFPEADIAHLAVSMVQEGMRELSSLAPLGAGVYAKARVPDTSRLLVDVGLGFHVECSLDEALAVASLRRDHLAQRAEERNRQVASIKANIALVEQGLAGFPARD